MIGYIGAKTPVSLKDPVDILDWRMRLTGNRNEFGAHAGFTSVELHDLLATVFFAVDERTREYFSRYTKIKRVSLAVSKHRGSRVLFIRASILAE